MTCSTSELRYTPPHAACAHPEYWHSQDGDSTETEVGELVAALVRAVQPELVVETGSAYGYTTRMIGEALHRNGHGRLVSFEIDAERAWAAQDLLNAGAEAGGPVLPVEILLGSSLDWTPEEMIGFAFFDSLYELRAREFVRYKPWLAAGTLVAFHDTTSGLRGHYLDVRTEVEKLAADGLLRLVFVPSPRGLAIGEVL